MKNAYMVLGYTRATSTLYKTMGVGNHWHRRSPVVDGLSLLAILTESTSAELVMMKAF